MPLSLKPGLPDRYVRGEQNALESVYRAHVDGVAMVLRYGFVLDAQGGKRVPGVGSHDELKDLLQETFARTFSQKARVAYDAALPFRPYVQRIAKNLLVDHGRRLGRVSRIGTAMRDQASVSSDKVSEPDLDERRRHEAVALFTAALGEPACTLYQLRYVEGLSQTQVALAMNKTRKQIRLLEEKLRASLRQTLSEQGLVEENPT